VMQECISVISSGEKEKFLIEDGSGACLQPKKARVERGELGGRRKRERCDFIGRIFNNMRKLEIKNGEIGRKGEAGQLSIVSTTGVQIEQAGSVDGKGTIRRRR